MLLVHVVARSDARMLFPQFDGALRIAFQVHRFEQIERGQSEHLAHDTEHEHIRAEGRIVRHALLPGTIHAQLLEGHRIMLYSSGRLGAASFMKCGSCNSRR